jgi:ABC-type uncharacterized transport system auxiliary subunit
VIRLSLALALALLTSGCFGGAAPPRFFDPLLPPSTATPQPVGPFVVRLRKVEATSTLKERIQWRKSDVETGFYESERWATEPAYVLWTALRKELYEVRGLRSGGPRAPYVLDVELSAFEEVLLPEHRVRVRVSVVLATQEETALRVQTYDALRPVESESAEAMARAMGLALRDVIDALAAGVLESLGDATQESEDSK